VIHLVGKKFKASNIMLSFIVTFIIGGVGMWLLLSFFESQTYFIVYVLGLFILISALGLQENEKDS
jgi:hypothetical protein